MMSLISAAPPVQTPTFLYPLQGAYFIAQRRNLWTRVGSNLGKYILYAIPTLLMLYIGYALHSVPIPCQSVSAALLTHNYLLTSPRPGEPTAMSCLSG